MSAIRKLPRLDKRMETGAVQFEGEPYPGIFLRGDDALRYAGLLKKMLPAPVRRPTFAALIALLESCYQSEAA